MTLKVKLSHIINCAIRYATNFIWHNPVAADTSSLQDAGY